MARVLMMIRVLVMILRCAAVDEDGVDDNIGDGGDVGYCVFGDDGLMVMVFLALVVAAAAAAAANVVDVALSCCGCRRSG